MKLNLSPDVESGLLAQAQARGLSLEDYLDQVLHTLVSIPLSHPADQSAVDIYVEGKRDAWQVKSTGIERKRDVFSIQADAIGRAKELRPAGESAVERVRDFSSPDTPAHRKRKRPSELFAPLRGLDIDLSRNPSTGRPVEL